MEAKFLDKVEKTETCWNWTGRLNVGGYGRFSRGGCWKQAHRISYEIYKGPIPEGLVVRHMCVGNRKCVNPAHLEVGTHKDNTADMFRDNPPDRTGNNSHARKISQEDANEIRQWREFGYTQQSIGDLFGLGQGHISTILSGKRW
jgi:hypothetical protein